MKPNPKMSPIHRAVTRMWRTTITYMYPIYIRLSSLSKVGRARESLHLFSSSTVHANETPWRRNRKRAFFFAIIFCVGGAYASVALAQLSGSEPMQLHSGFAATLSLPIPISPQGPPLPEGKESNVTFEWSNVHSADSYELYIKEGNGKTHRYLLKETPDLGQLRFACANDACKSASVTLSGRVGQWWVQALNVGSKLRSNWSRSGFFGLPGDKYTKCVKPLNEDDWGYPIEPGDLTWTRVDALKGEWTVGLAALAQAIKYDFGKKKAGFNSGLGAGASFRFYRDVYAPGQGEVRISRIKGECRATTFQLREDTDLPDAAPAFSITPVIFASQIVGEDNLRVEPALMLGFWEDIINVGAGFNLTGKDGEVGDVFLLLSIGVGFNFQ